METVRSMAASKILESDDAVDLLRVDTAASHRPSGSLPGRHIWCSLHISLTDKLCFELISLQSCSEHKGHFFQEL